MLRAEQFFPDITGMFPQRLGQAIFFGMFTALRHAGFPPPRRQVIEAPLLPFWMADGKRESTELAGRQTCRPSGRGPHTDAA